MVIIIVIVIIAGAHLNSTPVPTHDYFYLVYFITDYSATIGGLKEKLYGAMRAGIKKVLIPWDNRRDLEEVSQEVKDSLEIVPVKRVEDVLKETLNVHLASYEIPRLAAENATIVI